VTKKLKKDMVHSDTNSISKFKQPKYLTLTPLDVIRANVDTQSNVVTQDLKSFKNFKDMLCKRLFYISHPSHLSLECSINLNFSQTKVNKTINTNLKLLPQISVTKLRRPLSRIPKRSKTDLDRWSRTTDLDRWSRTTDLDRWSRTTDLDRWSRTTDLDQWSRTTDLDRWSRTTDLDRWSRTTDLVDAIDLGQLPTTIDAIDLGQLPTTIDAIDLGQLPTTSDAIDLGQLPTTTDAIDLGQLPTTTDAIDLSQRLKINDLFFEETCQKILALSNFNHKQIEKRKDIKTILFKDVAAMKILNIIFRSNEDHALYPIYLNWINGSEWLKY
jgi:hypothetical protein